MQACITCALALAPCARLRLPACSRVCQTSVCTCQHVRARAFQRLPTRARVCLCACVSVHVCACSACACVLSSARACQCALPIVCACQRVRLCAFNRLARSLVCVLLHSSRIGGLRICFRLHRTFCSSSCRQTLPAVASPVCACARVCVRACAVRLQRACCAGARGRLQRVCICRRIVCVYARLSVHLLVAVRTVRAPLCRHSLCRRAHCAGAVRIRVLYHYGVLCLYAGTRTQAAPLLCQHACCVSACALYRHVVRVFLRRRSCCACARSVPPKRACTSLSARMLCQRACAGARAVLASVMCLLE